MGSNAGMKAAIAFLVWVAIGLISGFLGRDVITGLLGPDIWLGAALWAGTISGLINVLVVLMLSRR